jgi:hypothetical protein
MLLTITNRSTPARDLGYLLRKHPDRAQSFELPFAVANVFYPVANDDECTAAMFLDVDPVALVRGKPASAEGGLFDSYVNDRAYVFIVSIGRDRASVRPRSRRSQRSS